jgi:Family of unknown function (DUF5522)
MPELPNIRENEDYYFENGLMVFTRRFHQKRGRCCGSGCRHCPYAPRWTKGVTTTEENPESEEPPRDEHR